MSSRHPWTEPGRVNSNNQKVLYDTGEPGSHPNQRFFLMECQDHPGERYKSNGCDIWERKCPQQGVPVRPRGIASTECALSPDPRTGPL